MLSRRSFFRRTSAAVLVSCASLPTLLADDPRPMAGRANKPLAVPTTPSAAFLETIDAKHRDAVSAVMRSPTITSKSAEEIGRAHV